jgi:hypothetical protein
MKKNIWSLLMLAIMLSAFPALSQSTPRLSNLEIDLWPEYDHPSVLVIYHITLAPETTLPTELTFQIPAAAGAPNAVAVRQPDGQLFTIDYNTQINGDWELITFTATLPEIQVEYYDPGLKQDGSQKSFTYMWPGDYAVDKMLLQVQQPVGATNMQITPGPVSQVTGGDGMTYYTKEIGSTTQGQTFSIEIAYQKESSQLSVSTLEVQPSAPLSSNSTWLGNLRAVIPWLFPESGSPYQVLPWILGILALVLIFGGGYWYWRTGREDSTPKRRRRSKGSTNNEDRTSLETGNIYCHQCGKRASPGDSFCRACGSKLRTE